MDNAKHAHFANHQTSTANTVLNSSAPEDFSYLLDKTVSEVVISANVSNVKTSHHHLKTEDHVSHKHAQEASSLTKVVNAKSAVAIQDSWPVLMEDHALRKHAQNQTNIWILMVTADPVLLSKLLTTTKMAALNQHAMTDKLWPSQEDLKTAHNTLEPYSMLVPKRTAENAVLTLVPQENIST